ncbi:MAG TPA: glycine betaine ABC transporter substrate-binding protein [Beutenbergiaceae bacterium]|nr:glycine betaine ABC transporter substrate-binding protein [Beutenbergiaceae bacterium]
MTVKRRGGAIIATTAAVALTLAACGDDGGNGGNGDNGDNGGAADPADAEPIVVGVHSGWEEGIAVSHLWQHVLEEQGYTVELETADAGIVFTGLAAGDYDLNFDTWLPLTHDSYIEEAGEDVEELGIWLEEAPLTIAVNADAPIDSLDELADNADLFDNRLIGIEAGAGLTEQTQNEAIPTYGLEDMEYLISSTPAMLTELSAALDAGDNVAVTLWRPHWAYDEFDIKDLEDPEGAMGEPDDIYNYATAGFSEEYPEVAEWIEGFELTHDELHELENIMFNEMDGEDNDAAVQQWVDENPEIVDGITGG